MNRFFYFFLWLILFTMTISVKAVSLKIVRPESAESLTMGFGLTYVIGTVSPADSQVSCNGMECEVDEDGAFIGFVPIRKVKDWVEVGGKLCDAQFEFIAQHGEEIEQLKVPVFTPRSPSAALVAQEVFDSPQAIRIIKDQWIGLEGEELGKLVYVPEGSVLFAQAKGNGSYRCSIHDPIEISISELEAEISNRFYEKPPFKSEKAFLIESQEDTRVQVKNLLGQSSFSQSNFLNPWGCEIRIIKKEIEIAPHSSPLSLKNLHICLDPGHHPDRGAIGPRGFEERESVLLLSREIERLLKIEGVQVSYTREENALTLKERHARLHKLKPDLVISIHHNSVGDGQDPRLIRGTQTFYLHPWSKSLAESMHHSILQHMRTKDRGCIRRNLYMTRFLECPVILIEPEYIVLPDQEKKFMDKNYRCKLAQAITEGIRKFVVSQSK